MCHDRGFMALDRHMTDPCHGVTHSIKTWHVWETTVIMCPPSTSTPLDHPGRPRYRLNRIIGSPTVDLCLPAPTSTLHPEGPASFGPCKIPKETKSVQRHRHTERKAKALHVQTLCSPALPPGLHVPMEKWSYRSASAHRRPLRAAPALRIAYALVATNTCWGLTIVTRETPCRGVCTRTRFRHRSASIVAAVSAPLPCTPVASSSTSRAQAVVVCPCGLAGAPAESSNGCAVISCRPDRLPIAHLPGTVTHLACGPPPDAPSPVDAVSARRRRTPRSSACALRSHQHHRPRTSSHPPSVFAGHLCRCTKTINDLAWGVVRAIVPPSLLLPWLLLGSETPCSPQTYFTTGG
ncbi:hypothetical protein B0H14DRAFT_2657248 [Mycena olivaceomarginata]|nr:hypothetical protein B0H14DRAFT_2657248 [Mycena olivaceomarginata]